MCAGKAVGVFDGTIHAVSAYPLWCRIPNLATPFPHPFLVYPRLLDQPSCFYMLLPYEWKPEIFSVLLQTLGNEVMIRVLDAAYEVDGTPDGNGGM